MQIRCEHCGHEGEAADAKSVDGEIWVVCGSCGVASPLLRPSKAPMVRQEETAKEAAQPESTRYASSGDVAALERVEVVPPSVAPQPAAGLPAHKCPKCGHRQDDGFACHKCGLVFANAQKRRPWEEVPANRKVAYARVENAFRRLVGESSDEAAHAAFEAYAAKEMATEHAIRLYRHHLADFPDDMVSQAALRGLVQRAQTVAQSLAREQIKTTVGATSRSLKWGLSGLVVLLLLAAALFLVKLLQSQRQMLP